MNFNFSISEIKHYKKINKLSVENKYFIFTINIKRKFDSRKTNKLTQF